MKNLVSKEELKRRERRNQRIGIGVGVFLILIMIFSSLGYSFLSRGGGGTSSKEGFKYNGVDFTSNNAYFIAQIGKNSFGFLNDPRTLERTDSKVSLANTYSGVPLYISSEDGESRVEIKNNFGQISLRMQEACLGRKVYSNETINQMNSTSNETLQKVKIVLDKPCNNDYPIKTCDDKFIIVEESNVTEIVQDNNCVFIRGPKSNLSKITDSFLLKTLGIDA